MHITTGFALRRSRLILALILGSSSLLLGQAKAPYQDASLPVEKRIDDLLARMTPEEKAKLCYANSKFAAGGVERLGVPWLWTADGPQGVREEVGLHDWNPLGLTTDYATAMPPGATLAATWNPELARLYGSVVGEEARARGKHVILGPGLNIQRTPICGRNFDYFGEDPWLSGRMTVGYVKGMQSEQTIACIKHFAVNNQEDHRMNINSEVDERGLREIYLPAFEAGIKEGGAMAIMGAYNRFRGQFCCHNDYLLNQILKKEWNFQGGVISDWDATHDEKQPIVNGLDLEMGMPQPYENSNMAKGLQALIKNGAYPASILEDKARRNLRMLYFAGAMDGRKPGLLNSQPHIQAARTVAQEGIVLLKNGGLLPINPASARNILVVGENAVRSFTGGGNAAGVKAFREISILQGILTRVGSAANVTYTTGYTQPARLPAWNPDALKSKDADKDPKYLAENKALADRAVEAAKQAGLVIYVGGYCHQSFGDDENLDRPDMALPGLQNELIERLATVNPRLVVTLVSGGPITMPWLDKVPSLLQAWYGGCEAGNALASVLFGDVNPSGKLPCTFPKALKDVPAHQNEPRTYPGLDGTVHYDEGLLVGYRWFDTKKVEPLFPFGFGLSYTTFSYGNLKVTGEGTPAATIECEVTNTGSREGAEVVQLYVQPKKPSVLRPEKELKGFAKVSLKPGETKKVSLSLDGRSFAYYEPTKKGWVAEKGEYGILVGASSRDIRLTGAYKVAKTTLQ